MEVLEVLTLVLCLAASVAPAQGLQTIELSMMTESIDDMFTSCGEKMATKVQVVYFPREIPFIQSAWNSAESCAKTNQDKLPDEHKALTKDDLQAICVYTQASTGIYSLLNKAVRTSATMYDTPSFQYHALYFWLTRAIQVLPKSCETTYRRTRDLYTGKVGTTMRFGQFTSTSRRPDLVDYGTESCFHIKTCFGAYIGDYSVAPHEEEVLVPSYEVFEIVRIEAGSYGKLKCKMIFVLESAGRSSELNCKAANHSKRSRADIVLVVVLQFLIGLAVSNYANAPN